MSLLKLQRELAALLIEEPARRAFAEAPRAYARRRLAGKDAALLASLDPGDVGYFASRRRIDRLAALRVDVPRAAALLEGRGDHLRYFRAHPYALEDAVKEAARLARWAAQAARKGQVPPLAADLARYEAAHLALRARAPRPARPSAAPRRAPGLVLLALAHDLGPALADDGPPAAPARRCLVALHRTTDGVEAGEVRPLVWHLLKRADGRRSAASLARQAAEAAGTSAAAATRALRALRREGVLSPAPAAPRRREG